MFWVQPLDLDAKLVVADWRLINHWFCRTAYTLRKKESNNTLCQCPYHRDKNHENHDIAIAMSSSSRVDTDSVLAGGI